MAATMKDLSRETGLGLATLSKYFNGGTVREKNRVLMDYLERHYKKKDGILKDLEKRNRTSLDKRIRELRRDRDMIGSLLEEMKRS